MRRRYLHGDPTRPYKACAQQQVLKTSCSLLICGLKFNWSVYKPAQCLTNLCLFKAIKILHKHWNHELCIQFLNHKFIVCKFYVRINTESNWVKLAKPHKFQICGRHLWHLSVWVTKEAPVKNSDTFNLRGPTYISIAALFIYYHNLTSAPSFQLIPPLNTLECVALICSPKQTIYHTEL